jgi:hypothetical protein
MLLLRCLLKLADLGKLANPLDERYVAFLFKRASIERDTYGAIPGAAQR